MKRTSTISSNLCSLNSTNKVPINIINRILQDMENALRHKLYSLNIKIDSTKIKTAINDVAKNILEQGYTHYKALCEVKKILQLDTKNNKRQKTI